MGRTDRFPGRGHGGRRPDRGFIGVYAKWFSYEYQVESGVVTIFLDGTWDMTGALAVTGGSGRSSSAAPTSS